MNSITDEIARRTVWKQASQFDEAADFLWDRGIYDFMLPIIVNYAFACELAIKSCNCTTRYNVSNPLPSLIPTASFKSNIRVRDHNLVDLFAQLSQQHRIAIERRFREQTEVELLPLLEDCQSCFVDGRYEYENRPCSFPLSGLRRLSNGLVAVTKDFGG